MRDRSVGEYGAEVAFVKRCGGVFGVMADGRLAFSKKELGHFPTDEKGDALGPG